MTTSHARTYYTVTEIRQANADAGQHFFDASSMRFFRSRVLRGVIGGRFFITSEQHVPYDGEPSPRMYSVRVVDAAGRVDTVGDFQGYATAAQARSAARRAAATHSCGRTDEMGRPVAPEVVTCGICDRSWCERCDPAPSALCHYCHGRGTSTAPVTTA